MPGDLRSRVEQLKPVSHPLRPRVLALLALANCARAKWPNSQSRRPCQNCTGQALWTSARTVAGSLFRWSPNPMPPGCWRESGVKSWPFWRRSRTGIE